MRILADRHDSTAGAVDVVPLHATDADIVFGLAVGARYARHLTQGACRLLVLGVLVTMGMAGVLTLLFG